MLSRLNALFMHIFAKVKGNCDQMNGMTVKHSAITTKSD